MRCHHPVCAIFLVTASLLGGCGGGGSDNPGNGRPAPDLAGVWAGNWTQKETKAQGTFVGTAPQGVAFSPDGRKLYVANQGAVSLVSTVTNKVLVPSRSLPNTARAVPSGIAASPDGKRVQVGLATGIAISPDGSQAYVTDRATRHHLHSDLQERVAVDRRLRRWRLLHRDRRPRQSTGGRSGRACGGRARRGA